MNDLVSVTTPLSDTVRVVVTLNPGLPAEDGTHVGDCEYTVVGFTTFDRGPVDVATVQYLVL